MTENRTYIEDSLLVTPELCESRDGCGEGLEFMQKRHPQGFTVEDVYLKKVRHIPMSFVCWGYHYLPFTEKDKQQFIEFAQIVDSTQYYQSHHIKNCARTSHSSYCENCADIDDSDNVFNSTKIGQSHYICDSHNIKGSSEVKNSEFCAYSNHIENCQYMHKCTEAQSSSHCSESNNIDNSYLLHNVNNAKYCIASIGHDIANRIFCSDKCPAAEYAIFDKPVSEMKFKSCFSRLLDCIAEEEMVNILDPNFAYIPSRAHLIGQIMPMIEEIFPDMTPEDELLIFKTTQYTKAPRQI